MAAWPPARLAKSSCAAPLHRFALHRRQRGHLALLLFIASLCIVASAVILRCSSSSLRSASSPARSSCAAPLHRFALHRRQRGHLALLLFIASLCIVASAVIDSPQMHTTGTSRNRV